MKQSDILKKYEIPETGLTPVDKARLSLECGRLDLEVERTAHARWWQEDSLVNQRLTWLLYSQTVLLAVYGLLLRDDIIKLLGPAAHDLAVAFPYIGLAVCVVIALGISAAWSAQRILQTRYEAGGFEVGVSKATTRIGRVPAHTLPLVFVASWGWLCKSLFGVRLAFGLALIILLTAELCLIFQVRRARERILKEANPGGRADGNRKKRGSRSLTL